MIRNRGAADRAQVDRLERPELVKTVGGHHLAGFDESITAPVEMLPGKTDVEEASCRLQDAHAFGNNFAADPIAFDYSNFVAFQSCLTCISWWFACYFVKSAVSLRISGSDSRVETVSTICLALLAGQPAKSAQP